MDLKQQVASSAAHATPAVTLVGTYFAGLSLPEWAAIAGIAFVGLQAVHLLWRWRSEVKARGNVASKP